MSEFYENLLRATDNTKDITNEKYATITKVAENGLCSVLEEDTNLEHSDVPVLNKLPVDTGDKVVLGFVDNSIYNPYIIGNLTKEIQIDTEHPCRFQVLGEDLTFDFTDADNDCGTDPVTDEKNSTKIIESSALSHLGTGAGANQHEINLAIDSKIGSGGTGLDVTVDMDLMDNGYLKISAELISTNGE